MNLFQGPLGSQCTVVPLGSPLLHSMLKALTTLPTVEGLFIRLQKPHAPGADSRISDVSQVIRIFIMTMSSLTLLALSQGKLESS